MWRVRGRDIGVSRCRRKAGWRALTGRVTARASRGTVTQMIVVSSSFAGVGKKFPMPPWPSDDGDDPEDLNSTHNMCHRIMVFRLSLAYESHAE